MSSLPDASAPEVGPYRFVRLEIQSEYGTRGFASAAEFDLLGLDATLLDRAEWTATADSEELAFGDGTPASRVIDGRSESIWHTAWFTSDPPGLPHFLQIDLGRFVEITGFRYLGRQDERRSGRVRDYRFFASRDGLDWGEPLLSGTLDETRAAQSVSLASAISP